MERRRELAEAGRTLVVRPGSTLVVSAAGAAPQATQYGMRPRVRSGYALKRMDADEGPRRWVLRDLSRDSYLRLSDNDAALFELLDGSRSLIDLIGECERRFGPTGAARLARLLADLGERGFLAGRGGRGGRRRSGRRRSGGGSSRRARRSSAGSGRSSTRCTGAGGWVLFTRPLLWAHRGAVRGRRGRLRAADRPPLRDAVRGRGQDRDRRPRLPARPLPRGRRARDRARAHDGLVRPAGRQGGAEAHRDLPVRVRGHERGVVRAAAAADRDQRGRAGGGLLARRDLLASAASRCPRGTSATSSSSSRSPATSARSSTSTRSWSATATTCSSTGCASRGCGGGRGSSSRAGSPASRRRTTRRCSRATRVWGLAWSVLAAGFAIVMTLRFEPVMTALAPPAVVHIVMGTLWAAFFVPVLVVDRAPAVGAGRGAVWEHEPWPLTSPTSPRG